MKIRKIEFPCGDITLEGMIFIPEGPGPFGLVVVCHPHPLYGGNMFNNVVHGVCAKLGENGLAWLKFNFRGVGNSGGRYADGIGEQDDARAAVSFAEKQEPVNPAKIGICGYSFGSIVALAVAAKDPRLKAVAGISPFYPAARSPGSLRFPKAFCYRNPRRICRFAEPGRTSEKPSRTQRACPFSGRGPFLVARQRDYGG